jgi:hypothetical protein
MPKHIQQSRRNKQVHSHHCAHLRQAPGPARNTSTSTQHQHVVINDGVPWWQLSKVCLQTALACLFMPKSAQQITVHPGPHAKAKREGDRGSSVPHCE